MKAIPKSSVLILTFVCLSNLGFAQKFDSESVKKGIEEASLLEQNAFKTGDCEQVLALMADDITFLANGRRVPSKQVIGKFCNSIPRPFKTPTVYKLDIYPLTETTGYTIRTLEYPKTESIKMSEFVTKIWEKTDGEWKMTHLHSTVKEVAISN